MKALRVILARVVAGAGRDHPRLFAGDSRRDLRRRIHRRRRHASDAFDRPVALVEVRLGDVLCVIAGADPGVVHEDVEPAELANDLVDGGLDLAEIEHVHLDREGPATHRLDLGRGALARRVVETEGDVRAGMGEGEGDRPAQAAGRAGHERNAPAEVEAGKVVHRASGRSSATP